MARKRKIKYFPTAMKFNPGTLKFEPELSADNRTEQENKVGWFWIILLIIGILILLALLS